MLVGEQIVMNLPAEQGWVSKNLPWGPRAKGQVFTDPPKLCWQVDHSCSSNRMLEQFPAVAAAVAAESFTTEQVCKILSTVRARIKMEDWTAVFWSNKNESVKCQCVNWWRNIDFIG